MTKREAAIVSAYTGYLLGSFSDTQEYIEELMGRPVFTHELGSETFADELREKAKPDFIALEVKDDEQVGNFDAWGRSNALLHE